MKKYFLLASVLSIFIFGFGQKKANPDAPKLTFSDIYENRDTIQLRSRSYRVLKGLKDGDGYILVQLKRNKRSINAYRQAGRNELADRLEDEQRLQNEKIAEGFYRNFKFCRFYIIYADETPLWLQGKANVALKADLKYDSLLLHPSDSNYIFCQYGSAQTYSAQYGIREEVSGGHFYPTPRQHELEINSQKINVDTMPIQNGTDAFTNSALVLFDKDMRQMYRPFPYVMEVYFRNFSSAVRKLNDALYQAYYKQVLDYDMHLKRKAEKKKEKEREREMQKERMTF